MLAAAAMAVSVATAGCGGANAQRVEGAQRCEEAKRAAVSASMDVLVATPTIPLVVGDADFEMRRGYIRALYCFAVPKLEGSLLDVEHGCSSGDPEAGRVWDATEKTLARVKGFFPGTGPDCSEHRK
ncbi:hypothetical protein HZC20_01995 [Candidatus Peregrinibacteria bacterium]|nr:hypothetical protein [Candidatus Peregrinibacteria bacterium]